MPVVIFFECLDPEQKSSFMDGHWLKSMTIFMPIKLLEKIVLISTNYTAIRIPNINGAFYLVK